MTFTTVAPAPVAVTRDTGDLDTARPLRADDVSAVGFDRSPRDLVCHLARLAVEAGAGAIVRSPAEVADVRRDVGPGGGAHHARCADRGVLAG